MDDKRIKEICKIGQGVKTCRYILVGKDGFECAKDTDCGKVIDGKVARGEFSAESINCDGYKKESNDGQEQHNQ